MMGALQLKSLNTAALGRNFLHIGKVTSTNDYLKENAAALPHGTALIADEQTAGKGRLGRSWSEAPGQNLALSFLLKEDLPPQSLTLLPLVAAVAVRSALAFLTGTDFSIKWSNDILHDRKKICGILCESRMCGNNTFAVVGAGVNLTQDEAGLAALGLVYATSLRLATQKIYTRQAVAVEILNQFELFLLLLQKDGVNALLQEYQKHCITLGRKVRVLENGREMLATAVDIASDGSLVCEKHKGMRFSVNAGEVSVRGLYGYAD